jgi:CubicO group peptidase (beta-lactamase class C family)
MPPANDPIPPGLANQVRLVPAERDITIRDLMTHTSGLSSGGAGRLVNTFEHGPSDTLAGFVPCLGKAALDFQPGSRWSYSPADGIDVLLRIVEIVSKTPAEIFLRERIHEPLNMRDTYFNVPPAKQSRILTLYAKQDGVWKPQRAAFGNEPTRYISGAGGSMSTAHDYIQFEEMLLNKGELNGRRLLKPESVMLMSTNATGDMYHGVFGDVKGTGFGLTVRVMKDPVAANSGRLPGAFGWYGAYGTTTWTDPADHMVAALMVQQSLRTVPTLLPDFEHAIRRAVIA